MSCHQVAGISKIEALFYTHSYGSALDCVVLESEKKSVSFIVVVFCRKTSQLNRIIRGGWDLFCVNLKLTMGERRNEEERKKKLSRITKENLKLKFCLLICAHGVWVCMMQLLIKTMINENSQINSHKIASYRDQAGNSLLCFHEHVRDSRMWRLTEFRLVRANTSVWNMNISISIFSSKNQTTSSSIIWIFHQKLQK